MKTIQSCLLLAGFCAGLALRAAEPAAAPPTNNPPASPTAPNAGAVASQSGPVTTAAPMPATNNVALTAGTSRLPATASAALSDTNHLRLNFRGAPLDLVLDYLSDAAGFIINKQTEVRGTVDVWSKDPVTKDEAVELLNSVLKKNGYAVTRNDRILTIVNLDSAKTSDLPVLVVGETNTIQKSDEMITSIIPVSYANVKQLVENLKPLLPLSAELSANESANSLILVSTKTDVARMLKIIKGLDTSIASVSSIRVFPLSNATAKDLANEITQLFNPQQSAQPTPGMGPRAFFQMMRGGGQPNAGATSNGAVTAKVTAVADDTSNSVIVSAPENLMATISDMIAQLDQPINDLTEIRVFRLRNADPTELANQFTQLFPNDNTSNANQNRGFRFFGGPFAAMSQANQQSERQKKLSQVSAVPDPRTGSLIVTASKTLMPQIEAMIAALDGSPGKKEVVSSFELQNADPQDVFMTLQTLFNRNTTMRNNTLNQNTMLGQNNPLTQRQIQSATTASGVGGSPTAMGQGGAMGRTGGLP
ncbi:MAG: hypothetical protein KGS61_06030 [Verrucomicrobia bacterium]|nr:hypothetical protein [Verrucomicrobiota bacterium]